MICGDEIPTQLSGWSEGHNADPVSEGRCCDLCNDVKVLPARLDRMLNSRVALLNSENKEE